MSYYKQQLKEFLAKEKMPEGKILSIGAQHDDRLYFKDYHGQEWKTLDVDREFKPDILFNMNRFGFDVEGDGSLFEYQEYFDAVFAFELWEYIYSPLEAHKNIFSLLKPGGIYMGSYPFVYGKHNPPGQDFLRYTDDGIKKLLSVAGFHDVEITPRTGVVGSLESFYAVEEMRVRKDVDHNVVGYIVKAKK